MTNSDIKIYYNIPFIIEAKIITFKPELQMRFENSRDGKMTMIFQ